MNILFFAEIYPLRNNSYEYYWVTRNFLLKAKKLLKRKNVNAVKIITNEGCLNLAIRQDGKNIENFFIPLQENVKEKLKKEIVDWSQGGINKWKDYFFGESEFAVYLRNWLKKIKATVFDFDMVISWGPNDNLALLCDELEIPCFTMELGAIRQPFRVSEFVDMTKPRSQFLLNRLKIEDLISTLSPPPLYYWINYFKSIQAMGQNNVSDSKTVLIALQLYDDVNCQIYSSFNSPIDFIKEVLPIFIKNGWSVIVKGHPKAYMRPINQAKQAQALDYAKKTYPCEIYSGTNDNIALLSKVDAVVVVNSSLGFEASILGKIVCVLGQAVYKIDGAYPDYKKVAECKTNKQAYLKNLKYVVYFFIQFVYFSRSTTDSYERIIAIYELWKKDKGKSCGDAFPITEYIQLCHNQAESKRRRRLILTALRQFRRKIRATLLPSNKKKSKQYLTIWCSYLFDANWYLAKYPDVAKKKIDPIEHYLSYGALEGKNPGPLFDTKAYLSKLPCLLDKGINPLYHYLVGED